MAKTLFPTTVFSFITILFFLATPLLANPHIFSRNLSPENLGLHGEKLTHLRFYFHDIVDGPDATVVRIAASAVTNKSKTGFGLLSMIDDPLTVSPDPNSKLVGRAQGVYGSADKDELGLVMVMNFSFLEGKYNGSTLNLLGRNAVFSTVREMAIVGGTGVFRFARGYAQAKTYKFDRLVAIVEYNVYVTHY